MTAFAAEQGGSPKGIAGFTAKLKPLSVTDDDPETAPQGAATGTLAGQLQLPPSSLHQSAPAQKGAVRAAVAPAPTQGAPKLPHIIKPTKYALGSHALRALRLAHEDGTIPPAQTADTPSTGPASNIYSSYSKAQHSTGVSLSGLSASFPGTSFMSLGLSRTASPPPFNKLNTNLPLQARISNGPTASHVLLSPNATLSISTALPATVNPTDTSTAVKQEPSISVESMDPQDDVLPSLYMNDDDELTGRILSLPNVLCHAANGDIFLVGLGEVQTMLHKRRLGKKGLAVLRRFEGATLSAWDVGREKAEDTYSLKWHQKHEAKLAATAAKRRATLKTDDDDPSTGPLSPSRISMSKSALAAAAAAATAEDSELAGMVGGGLSPELEMEVAAHVQASMDLVERHRQHLVCNSDRALAEVAKQQAGQAAAQRKQQAVEYVVKQLIPEKILAMANTRRTKLAASNQLFRRMKQSLAGSQNKTTFTAGEKLGLTVDVSEDGDVGNRSSNSRGGNGRWGKLQGVTGDALSGMPFIDDWSAAIRKLGKQDAGSGWDELLVANMVYVKGASADSQGAAVYTYHCQQLGVIPSTQVVTQLRCAESNMSHCKLGRRGAKALRHALTTNTTITSLDLTDNSLDAQGVAEIAAGMAAGTLANMAPKARKVLQDKWKALDWVKAFKQTGVDTVLAVPENMKSALEGKDVPMLPRNEGSSVSTSTCSSPTRGPTSPTKTGPAGPMIWEVTGGVGKSTTSKLNGKAAHEMSGRKKASLVKSGNSGPSAPNILSSYMSRIRSLDLSENLLGVNGAKVMANLLDPDQTPTQFLTELRLNKCGIPDVGGIAIFKALGKGNSKLSLLSMSNNECSNASAATLGETLAVNVGLHELDLSWNQIKPEGVHELCKGLDSNITLQRLDLSWNGLENQGVVRLGQMLMVNTGLKHLNLTNTRMGGEACIVLGEGIKANKRLEDLILNGNAVGDDGARHLMSALKQNDTLQFLGLQGSNMSTAARGQSTASEFNPLAPDGSYMLLLSNPPDRAVAVQLCQLEADSKTELMRNVKLDGRNINSVKNMKWPDTLPVQGMLTCDFVTRRSQKILQVLDHKKFQALVGQLDSSTMSDKEKSALVEVMAPFTYLYCHQIAQILKCFSMGGELVRSAALLFTRAADLEERVEAMTSVMQERDIHALQQALGWYSYLRFSNPTGHYELNMSTNEHQALAGRLKDVAYGEPSDGNNWHNIIHDLYTHTTKTPSNFGPPEAWKSVIPARGTLAFDFVSTATIPDDAQPISDDQLIDFLHHSIGVRFRDNGAPLPEADFGEADLQVALLRQEVGHQFFFTCTQVTRVISCFQYSPHRVEVVVLLYARILDRKNMWTIMYSMRAVEQSVLHWRLGMQLFDKSHPSGHYVLDLSNPAHEQVARRLVELAANNSTDVPFFWNIRLQGNKKNMVENRNMWGTITAESFTPFLEFDFISSDVPDCLLNKSKADWDAMTKGDRLDAATRLSRRMELQRIKDMYGHFTDGSGWAPHAWASSGQLFKPLLNKPPWLAAWDRLMRLLVRYDIRSGDINGDSYLEDIFDTYCSEEGELMQESFEALCKEWGYTRSEMHYHYRPLFESSARPSAAAVGNTLESGAPMPGDAPMSGSMSGGAPLPGDGFKRTSGAQIPGDLLLGRMRSSVTTLSRLQTSTRASTSGDGTDRLPPPPMVLDFGTFVDAFMREPAPDTRFKEIPLVTTSLTVTAAAKALKSLRKGNAATKK